MKLIVHFSGIINACSAFHLRQHKFVAIGNAVLNKCSQVVVIGYYPCVRVAGVILEADDGRNNDQNRFSAGCLVDVHGIEQPVHLGNGIASGIHVVGAYLKKNDIGRKIIQVRTVDDFTGKCRCAGFNNIRKIIGIDTGEAGVVAVIKIIIPRSVTAYKIKIIAVCGKQGIEHVTITGFVPGWPGIKKPAVVCNGIAQGQNLQCAL